MFRRLRKRIHGGWMRGNATVLVPSPRVADAWPFRAPERQPAPFLGDDGASCRVARGWGEVVAVFHPSFVPRRQNKPTNLSICSRASGSPAKSPTPKPLEIRRLRGSRQSGPNR
jgi:hypothetical protein